MDHGVRQLSVPTGDSPHEDVRRSWWNPAGSNLFIVHLLGQPPGGSLAVSETLPEGRTARGRICLEPITPTQMLNSLPARPLKPPQRKRERPRYDKRDCVSRAYPVPLDGQL
jgi:hypothetical protein